MNFQMIRIITLKVSFVIFLLSCPFLHAMESTVEVRAAVFYHTSEKFRNQYGDFGPTYEVEASFSCDPCCYAFWANVGWFNDRGEGKSNDCSGALRSCVTCASGSLVGNRPTSKIDVLNFSLGIKFPYYFCDRLVGYFGIGPVIGNVWLETNTRFGRRKTSKVAYGGVVKLGLDYYITQCVFVDLFVDYLYETVRFKRNVDIGGVKGGVGLGLRF